MKLSLRRLMRGPFRTQLMAVFLLIIIITVTTTTVLMSIQAARILRTTARENQMRIITQTTANLDSFINTIEQSYLYFAINDFIISNLRDLDDGDEYQRLTNTRHIKELMFSSITHNEALETVMFVSKGGSTISNLGGNIAPELLRSENPRRTELFDRVFNRPKEGLWFIDRPNDESDLYYLRGLFDPESGEVIGLLIFFVNSSRIHRQIADLSMNGGGVAVLECSGSVVASNFTDVTIPPNPDPVEGIGKGPWIDEDRTTITISDNLKNGWCIVSVVSKTVLFRKIRAIILLGVVVSVAGILVGVFLALRLSGRYSSDLSSLVAAMETSSSQGRLETISQRGSTEEFRTLAAAYNILMVNLDRLTGSLKDEIQQKEQVEAELRDLNENLEQKVANRTSELQESLKTLRLTQSHLIESEKMASLGSLVAGVAHEMNTPLGIAVTLSSFVEDQAKDFLGRSTSSSIPNETKIMEFAEMVHESAARLMTNLTRASDLIRNFKQVSVDQVSESQRQFFIREYFEVLVGSIISRQTPMTVSVNCPETLSVNSYPGVFGQILTNLILNARIHAFPDAQTGTVLIDVQAEQNSLIINFSDNGVGMTPEVRNNVFEPFYTTNRAEGGTGLGMHIVYNLVTQKLGGRIECISRRGRGSQFIITIPLDPENTGASWPSANSS